MKNKNIFIGGFSFILVFLLTIVTSCSPYYLYQIYTAEAIGSKGNIDNVIVFEDENCIVSYNLWKSKGHMSFDFYNKTDKNLYINLIESVFIMNGEAFDYFNTGNISETNSQSVLSETWTGFKNSTTSTTKFIAPRYPIICVPSKTSHFIQSDFVINDHVYRDCYLIYNPSDDGKTIWTNEVGYTKLKGSTNELFNADNSPFVFKNIIAYSDFQDETKVFHRIETPFYISEISNKKEKEITRWENDSICGEKQQDTYHFTISAANKFYIKYPLKDEGGSIETYAGH